MSRTVDFGIDLGTTNSAIARMTAKGPEVTPVRRMNYIPSAVAIDKRGDVKVGAEAINPHLEFARWFKRLMGTTNTLPLANGALWTPQQLPAEVLKALKAAAKLKTNEEVEDVVITVPAMFTQPQCAATNEAAELAGMNAVALLQEPIAAATAYLSESTADGHYLVYDLGGGTFDVSLIRLHEGEMNVVEHGGDNYLGGSDFDRAIFDWVLDQIDRKGGDTGQFGQGWQRNQLLLACEDARVAVSDEAIATIYLDDFNLPLAKIELTRERTEDLVSDFVTRTIEIAQDRLRPIAGSNLRSVLLVGGPTQMPYVRNRLSAELGLPLGLDQDPMTVVATGAAVHAGTIRRSGSVTSAPAKVGSARVDLHYEAVSPEDYASVAGRVLEPSGFQGQVRIASAGGDWETGWQNLTNGAFSTEVTLSRLQVTEFNVELRDPEGRSIPCEPSSFAIRRGVRTAQPVTPYDYGVVLEGGNKIHRIVKANEPLPANGVEEFRFAKTLIAGSPEEVTIYFVEGHSLLAGENYEVGKLKIRGADIRRNVRENEKVQIRIRMDDSRRLKANVHIPVLDEDYAVDLHSLQERADLDQLETSIEEARKAISEVENLATESEQATVMQAGRQLERLEALLQRVESGEVGEAERVQKQLADVKASIRPLRDKYGLQTKYDGIIEFIGEAEELCRHFRDEMGLAKLQDSRGDAEKALRLEQEKTLDSINERVREIFWEHWAKTRDCWEYQVELMRERAPLVADPLPYYELLRRAERSLAEGDYEGVRLRAWEAWRMLPEKERLSGRFQDAVLRR